MTRHILLVNWQSVGHTELTKLQGYEGAGLGSWANQTSKLQGTRAGFGVCDYPVIKLTDLTKLNGVWELRELIWGGGSWAHSGDNCSSPDEHR